MISSYFNAKLKIVSASRDENGVTTETISKEFNARVEKQYKYIKDKNGIEILVNGPIFIETSQDLTWDDKIIITQQYGIANLANKKNAIKFMEMIGGFEESHWEVWI